MKTSETFRTWLESSIDEASRLYEAKVAQRAKEGMTPSERNCYERGHAGGFMAALVEVQRRMGE